jgi:hypothetical protein
MWLQTRSTSSALTAGGTAALGIVSVQSVYEQRSMLWDAILAKERIPGQREISADELTVIIQM